MASLVHAAPYYKGFTSHLLIGRYCERCAFSCTATVNQKKSCSRPSTLMLQLSDLEALEAVHCIPCNMLSTMISTPEACHRTYQSALAVGAFSSEVCHHSGTTSAEYWSFVILLPLPYVSCCFGGGCLGVPAAPAAFAGSNSSLSVLLHSVCAPPVRPSLLIATLITYTLINVEACASYVGYIMTSSKGMSLQ